jgi:hypothetical protein
VIHHAHDFEESVRPLIFGGVTLVNQWRDATQRMGRKSTKELLSLASFFSYTLLSLLKVCPLAKSAIMQTDETRLYLGTQGLPELGLHPFHITKNLHMFSFS